MCSIFHEFCCALELAVQQAELVEFSLTTEVIEWRGATFTPLPKADARKNASEDCSWP